jgi:ribosomal protein L15E
MLTPDPYNTPNSRPYYYLVEATRILGYRHPGTVRAKHLATEDDAAALGRRYYDGRIILDKEAVHQLAERLQRARAGRGEWRSRNLGKYLKRRASNE